MASKLYIGGLSYSTTSDGLREYFAQSGSVLSATVITDRFSGQSRGFGFVEMEAAELYTLAARYQRRALAVLTISDHILTHEALPASEREQSFGAMIEVALEAAFA